jgi:hypothetical protein
MIWLFNTPAAQRLYKLVRRYQNVGTLVSRLLASRRAIGLLGFACFFGCSSSSPGSLSIKMFNPKTQSTLTCAARDNRGGDTSALAAIVETCARQLESQGFVRAN